VPLRPVSELGLVDLTELGPQKASQTSARRPPARANKTERESARRGATKKPRRQRTIPKEAITETRAKGASASADTKRRARSDRSRRLAAKVGPSVVAGGIAVAVAVLLGRAESQR
jgi:hypothetical protein